METSTEEAGVDWRWIEGYQRVEVLSQQGAAKSTGGRKPVKIPWSQRRRKRKVFRKRVAICNLLQDCSIGTRDWMGSVELYRQRSEWCVQIALRVGCIQRMAPCGRRQKWIRSIRSEEDKEGVERTAHGEEGKEESGSQGWSLKRRVWTPGNSWWCVGLAIVLEMAMAVMMMWCDAKEQLVLTFCAVRVLYTRGRK